MDEVSNAEKVRRINDLQARPRICHPLTCGDPDCRTVLRAEEHEGSIRLVCPDCSYVQTEIPKSAWEHDWTTMPDTPT